MSISIKGNPLGFNYTQASTTAETKKKMALQSATGLSFAAAVGSRATAVDTTSIYIHTYAAWGVGHRLERLPRISSDTSRGNRYR